MTMAAARGCSLDFSRLAAKGKISLSDNPAAGTIAVTLGLPSVSVPVLSTTRVLTCSMRSSASADLMRTPAPAPLPIATPIDIGVARPSAGTGDDDDGNRRDQRIGKRGSRTECRPRGEGENGNAEHR